MKKLILLSMLCLGVFSAQAQWFRVWKGEESTRYDISEIKTIPYAFAGSTLTVGEQSYATTEIDSITIINPVTITWNGASATIDIPENVEGVTYEIAGGHVVINNTNTCTEHEFILKGSSNDGSFTYNGNYKTKFHLNGISLTSTKGPAMDIECGKRIDLKLKQGTVNSFTDATERENYDETYDGSKAAFYCKGHMELSGAGSLTVTGNFKHAMSIKEYLFMKSTVGTLTINSAVSDGLRVGEYFMMNGGNLVVKNVGGDGIQVATKTNTEEELNGQFIMNGGSINVSVTAVDKKGIRLDDNATDEYVATVVPEMYINDGTITVDIAADAWGSRGIDCDGNITIGTEETSPTVNVSTDNTRYYTDPDTGEDKRACCIKTNLTLLIAGGTTTVYAFGPYARGIRAHRLRTTGGVLSVSRKGSNAQRVTLDANPDGSPTYKNEGGTIKGFSETSIDYK